MAVLPGVLVVMAALSVRFGISVASLEPQAFSQQKSVFNEEDSTAYVSALGDPGMRSPNVRVAVEGWNFCNRAGNLSNAGDPTNGTTLGTVSLVSGSPRWADCTDLVCSQKSSENSCATVRRVSDLDNNLETGETFPGGGFTPYSDTNLYAIEKEKFLGSLCATYDGDDSYDPWHFWMVMLKNGNFDESSGLCPIALEPNSSSQVVGSLKSFQPGVLNGEVNSGFPCFGPGCMNQPLVFLNHSQPQGSLGLAGGLYGTYDLNETDPLGSSSSSSFFSVNWYKKEIGGSWNFHHLLRVNKNYPWLMLYLRADATSGESGGYPWDTRGMMKKVPQSPNFRVRFTLDVVQGGGPSSQFYLMDIGGCWKNNGEQCDGDLATDVTRYSEMIINPDTGAWCGPQSLSVCPPFHTTANGTKIHRNDTLNFPYSAYHYYCLPYNALHAEIPYSLCDSYSNPQPQELMQLLPHPEWAMHGYPAAKGEGWVGDGRSWDLDVGALSSRLFFYQDPGTSPAIRKWPSLDIGTEIYLSGQSATSEWVLSDFNVLIPPS